MHKGREEGAIEKDRRVRRAYKRSEGVRQQTEGTCVTVI